MKKLIGTIFCILLFLPIITAQDVPQDVDTTVTQKIQQEHQATRQFISAEINKVITTAMVEFTKRADYYESAYMDITNRAILYLGLLWAGTYLFIAMLSKWLGTRTEKKKYQVLKEGLKRDIMAEIISELKVKLPITSSTDSDNVVHNTKPTFILKRKEPQPQPQYASVMTLSRREMKKIKKQQAWADSWKKKIQKKQEEVDAVQRKIEVASQNSSQANNNTGVTGRWR